MEIYDSLSHWVIVRQLQNRTFVICPLNCPCLCRLHIISYWNDIISSSKRPKTLEPEPSLIVISFKIQHWSLIRWIHWKFGSRHKQMLLQLLQVPLWKHHIIKSPRLQCYAQFTWLSSKFQVANRWTRRTYHVRSMAIISAKDTPSFKTAAAAVNACLILSYRTDLP